MEKNDLTVQAVMDLAKFMKTECLEEIQIDNVRIKRSITEALYRDQVAKAATLTPAGTPPPTDEQLLMDPLHGLNMTGATNV